MHDMLKNPFKWAGAVMLLALGLLSLATITGAAPQFEVTNLPDGSVKVTAADGASRDEFGQSVSVSGDIALVGAYRDDDNGTDSGSAYVFERGENDTWTQTAKLVASDRASNDRFGISGSVDGDVAVVGAYADNDRGTASGSAYVFQRGENGTWTQAAKLLASEGRSSDFFGYSVSVSENTALVGA